jgi:hypothetical protein
MIAFSHILMLIASAVGTSLHKPEKQAKKQTISDDFNYYGNVLLLV